MSAKTGSIVLFRTQDEEDCVLFIMAAAIACAKIVQSKHGTLDAECQAHDGFCAAQIVMEELKRSFEAKKAAEKKETEK